MVLPTKHAKYVKTDGDISRVLPGDILFELPENRFRQHAREESLNN